MFATQVYFVYNKCVATLKIIKDKEFLHKKSKPVSEFDGRLHQLIDDMRETLGNAGGVGLAAVQVGTLYRVCIIETDRDSGEYVELVNPEIIEARCPKKGEEGCLSVPKIYIKIVRPTKVTVRAFDRHGKLFERKFEKLAAVCACHEIDHLDGIIITDKITEDDATPASNKGEL